MLTDDDGAAAINGRKLLIVIASNTELLAIDVEQ